MQSFSATLASGGGRRSSTVSQQDFASNNKQQETYIRTGVRQLYIVVHIGYSSFRFPPASNVFLILAAPALPSMRSRILANTVTAKKHCRCAIFELFHLEYFLTKNRLRNVFRTSLQNENTYGETAAFAFIRIFISNHIAKLTKTQYVVSIAPNTICQGASRSSETFFDQFNFIFKQ